MNIGTNKRYGLLFPILDFVLSTIIPIIGSVVLTFYGFLYAKKIYLKEYDIPFKNFKENKRVVLLSDIHVGTFVDIAQLKKIVSRVNQLKADMVIIAGDLFDVEAFAYCDKEMIAQVLRELEPRGLFLRF